MGPKTNSKFLRHQVEKTTWVYFVQIMQLVIMLSVCFVVSYIKREEKINAQKVNNFNTIESMIIALEMFTRQLIFWISNNEKLKMDSVDISIILMPDKRDYTGV